jgi:hypothetical protein
MRLTVSGTGVDRKIMRRHAEKVSSRTHSQCWAETFSFGFLAGPVDWGLGCPHVAVKRNFALAEVNGGKKFQLTAALFPSTSAFGFRSRKFAVEPA